jgi:hypothetical protein
MARKRKNQNADPDAPRPPQWTPPVEDPDWREWMQHGIWGSEDICRYGDSLRLPSQLPFPFFSSPDRGSLSKNAGEVLDAAIVHFECHLGEIKNAPKIRDILIEKKQEEYDLNTEPGAFRLYLLSDLYHRVKPVTNEEKDKQREKLHFDFIHDFIDDKHFKPLIDFHMPEAVFKVFHAHVSMYPGCSAKRVELTEEQKKECGDKSKNKSFVVHVIVTAEGVEAFRTGRKDAPSEMQEIALRFYKDRCEKFGTPKGFGKPNGFVRLDKCMPLWTGKRYWRFSKNDANLWHLWADEYVNESEGSMHGSEYE